LAIGDYGNISYSRSEAGEWVALARFRDVDGVTRRVSAQGSSKSGAGAALKLKFKERASSGELSAESRVTELAEKYWSAKQGDNLAPNTLYNMRRALDNHVIPRLGKLRVREATPQRLDKVIRDITQENGPGTAQVVRSALSGMFSSAVRWGAAVSNPVGFTGVPKLESKAIRALTVSELWLMRQHAVKVLSVRNATGPSRRQTPLDIMDLLLATGCRAGESIGLAWEDVHLDDPVPWVEIRQQVQSVRGKGAILTATKEHDIRRLRLPQFAVDMLTRRKAVATGPMVFPSTKGGLIYPQSIGASWRAMFKGSEWAWVTQKTLRKTVATLVDAEHGSVMASRQLGHASDAVTRAHYIAQNVTPLDVGPILEQPWQIEA
jgi:integrase